MNNRGDNFDMCRRFCPDLNDLIEGVIVFSPAVGVTRRIFLDGAYENLRSADDLPPAYRDRENMRVPKRDIGCWNLGPVQIRLLDFDCFIRQARSADLLQVLDIYNKSALDAVVV